MWLSILFNVIQDNSSLFVVLLIGSRSYSYLFKVSHYLYKFDFVVSVWFNGFDWAVVTCSLGQCSWNEKHFANVVAFIWVYRFWGGTKCKLMVCNKKISHVYIDRHWRNLRYFQDVDATQFYIDFEDVMDMFDIKYWFCLVFDLTHYFWQN